MSECELEKRETLADIVSEMRECAESADPAIWGDTRIAGLVRNAKAQQIDYANRIEAAWKLEREAVTNCNHLGNAAAMREALEGMCKASQEVFCSFARETFYGERRLDSLGVAFDKTKVALALPPRNCDVGTAEEQERRYKATGEVYYTLTLTNALRWAQTPYEQEGSGK